MTTPLTVEQVREIARQEILLATLQRIEAKMDTALRCPPTKTHNSLSCTFCNYTSR